MSHLHHLPPLLQHHPSTIGIIIPFPFSFIPGSLMSPDASRRCLVIDYGPSILLTISFSHVCDHDDDIIPHSLFLYRIARFVPSTPVFIIMVIIITPICNVFSLCSFKVFFSLLLNWLTESIISLFRLFLNFVRFWLVRL